VNLWFDRDGAPIDAVRACALLADPEYKRVARTTIVSAADVSVAYDVSTVWLAVDHSFGGDDGPVIFETMVFGDDRLGLDTDRYCTEAQARAGHTVMVATVYASVPDAVVVEVETKECAVDPLLPVPESRDDLLAVCRWATQALEECRQRTSALTARRAEVLAKLHASGMTYSELAREMGLSANRVRQVVLAAEGKPV
jgi:hypothetical protein